MLSVRTIQERVRKSAILLDSEKPNWYRLIDLDNLYMGAGSLCVVGQIKRNTMTNVGIEHLDDMDQQRGFYLGYDYRPREHEGKQIDRMDYLTQLWKNQIQKRLRCDEKKAIDAMYRC